MASGSRRSSTADTVRLWTRGGLDAARRYFGPFLDPPTWIKAQAGGRRRRGHRARRCAGEPDFALLQARIKGERAGRRAEAVRLRGLRPASPRRPVAARRAARGAPPTPRRRPAPRPARAPQRAHRGATAWRSSRRPGRAASRGSWPRTAARRTYPASGRDRWQKIKIRPEQELVVGGWANGHRHGGRPRRPARRGLRGRRAPLRRQGRGGLHERQPRRAPGGGRAARGRRAAIRAAAPRAAARDARWLRPELVIRAEFAGWTGDGLVRQAAYKGLDHGKDPRAVRREVARSHPAMARNVQAP